MKHNTPGGRVQSERSTVFMRILTGSVKQRSASLNAECAFICTIQICIFGIHTAIYGCAGQ